MNPSRLMPRQQVPSLDLPLTTGGRYVGGQQSGERFDLLVFYRGLHCPICAKYLIELERLGEEFQKRGVRIIAISSDQVSRGQTMADKVQADTLNLLTGLIWAWRGDGVCTSAPQKERHLSGWKSQPCSASLGSF